MKSIKGWLYLLVLVVVFSLANIQLASAHQPVLEREQTVVSSDYFHPGIYEINDPTQASLAVYARLSSPAEIDFYSFTAHKTETIPVQILVPVRTSNQAFEPALVVMGPDISGDASIVLPFVLPPGYRAQVLYSPQPWPEFFEPFSFERLFTAAKSSVTVSDGQKYYLAVYSPGHTVGDYTIGIGTAENFSDSSLGTTLNRVGLMKLGLVDASPIPWFEMLGLLLFLSGIMISLVLIWQHTATTATSLWLGYFLALLGAIMLYHETSTNGVATFQALIALILLGNNFRLSKQLGLPESATRRKIRLSSVIAIAGWSAILLLLVWYLLVSR